ncbi:MAG: hypothetical protein BGO33_09685 [Bacteroidia bacterium 43-41]|nr:MAG: hypothetical protein BGO33_09685 [Bacteroidia bacterium 43-41]
MPNTSIEFNAKVQAWSSFSSFSRRTCSANSFSPKEYKASAATIATFGKLSADAFFKAGTAGRAFSPRGESARL